MVRRIRVVAKQPQTTFAERLEQRAHQLVRRSRQSDEREPIASMLDREVELTLDHLDRLRGVHDRIRRGLLRHECYLDTEIIQREPRPPVYTDSRLPERDRLRDRLRKVDEERRRWAVQYAKDRQILLDRLLVLVGRRNLLNR